MTHSISRRRLPAAMALAGSSALAAEGIWDGFPKQEYNWAKDVVGASHANLARVRELVDEHPTLANATIDWGFGDWETALGAAAHMGRRDIAEYLLDKGARLDIFAAAMLGMTAVVKEMIAARPGIEATTGPHGIHLLAHARAGGEKAQETFAYLKTLPGSAKGIPTQPFDDGKRKLLAGSYQIEGGPQKIELKLNSPSQLMFQVDGGVARPIHHAGNGEFYPAGAGSVRIRFTWAEEKVTGLTVADGTRVVRATRI